MDLCVTFFYFTRVKNLLNDLRVSRAPLQCHIESGTTTNTVCTYQIWYSLDEHADTCPFLKVSSTSLLLPLFHHQIFSPSLSSLVLIISKRSPSSCWEQWACMCVNCQYKTALAWAQMKTHSWRDWWISALEVLADGFFLRGGQITVCMKKIWLSLVDSCKRQVIVNIKQPIFLGETGYSKINSSNIFDSLFTHVFLFHALLHSFNLVGTFIFYETLSVNTYCCFP